MGIVPQAVQKEAGMGFKSHKMIVGVVLHQSCNILDRLLHILIFGSNLVLNPVPEMPAGRLNRVPEIPP